MPHFAAHHFITGFGVTGHIDAAYIDATTGINEQGERDRAFFPIEFGYRVDVGERVTVIAQTIADFFGGLGQAITREHFARLDGDELFQLGFRHQHLPRQLDVRHLVLRPFGHVDGDIDALFIRRNRHLIGINIKFQITAVEVKRAQGFDIPAQARFGILVIFAVPGQPTRRGRGELFQQFLFLERLVANNADLLDFGAIPFDHIKLHRNPVALQRRERGFYFDCVFSAIEILTLQFLLGLVQQSPVEYATLCQACLFQTGFQVFFGKLLNA